MSITLTPKKACANLVANRGRIAAFQLTRETTKNCFYRYDGIGRPDLCCGIGACLDAADLDELAADGDLMDPLEDLTGNHTIRLEPSEGYDDEMCISFNDDLDRLQAAHDAVFEITGEDQIAERRAWLNDTIDEFLATWGHL